MRLTLLFLIIISIIFPTGINASLLQKRQENCVICGHVCCCPEMCAPKIKELKEKRARRLSGCTSENSKCRLQSTESSAGLINTDK